MLLKKNTCDNKRFVIVFVYIYICKKSQYWFIVVININTCSGPYPAGGHLPPWDFQLNLKILLKYSAYSLVDTLIVDIVDNVW